MLVETDLKFKDKHIGLVFGKDHFRSLDAKKYIVAGNICLYRILSNGNGEITKLSSKEGAKVILSLPVEETMKLLKDISDITAKLQEAYDKRKTKI